MTPDLSRLSSAIDVGFWLAVVITCAAVMVCAIVAWINRPWWVRLALSRFAAWARRFRGAL